MTLDAISIASTVTAIHSASMRTGIDFNYLLAEAKAESGLDAGAVSATSSARGLYQFTRGTWLETVRKHGAEHGLAWAANAVADGRAAHDPVTRTAILDLRRDPAASASMAAAYTVDNAAKLAASLGRPATGTDLYLAHFLGAAGALHFLKARAAGPDTAAATVAPTAARSNHSVFFTVNGTPRSLSAVYDHFAAKFGQPVPSTGTDLPPARSFPALQVAAWAPDAARTAYLLLAELSA